VWISASTSVLAYPFFQESAELPLDLWVVAVAEDSSLLGGTLPLYYGFG
jgi:hypothetical protein